MPSLTTLGKSKVYSNYDAYKDNKNLINSKQVDLQNKIEKLATGKALQSYEELEDPETYLELKTHLQTLEHYGDTIRDVTLQLTTMKQSLQEAYTFFEDFLEKTVLLNNQLVRDPSLQTFAQETLNQLETLLNRTSAMGKDVFSGYKAGKAVNFSLLAPQNNIPSVPDPHYYIGDGQSASFQTSSTQTIVLRTLINGPAMEHGIRALTICAHLDPQDPQYIAKIRESQSLLRGSLGVEIDPALQGDSLMAICENVEQNLQILEKNSTDNQTEKTNLENNLADVEQTNLVQTLIETEREKAGQKIALAVTMQTYRATDVADLILRG